MTPKQTTRAKAETKVKRPYHRKLPTQVDTELVGAATAPPAKIPAQSAPAQADTGVVVPKPLPKKLTSMIVNNEASDPPIPAAPGYHLSTCGTDSQQRTKCSKDWHLCKAGEGYVTDETLCDTLSLPPFLIYNGDIVVCMSDEAYVEYCQRKEILRKGAVKAQLQQDKAEIDSVARQHGDRESPHIPTTATLRSEIGDIPDPDTITI